MKSGARLMVAVAALVFLATASAEARGGRGGGGGGRGPAPAAHPAPQHAAPQYAPREAQPAQREAHPAESRTSEHASERPANRSKNNNANRNSPNHNNANNSNANNDNNRDHHGNNPNAHRDQPFSPAWYAGHPGAWQYTHPYANVWAAASLGTAAAWLGLAGYDGAAYGTYYTSDTSDTAAPNSYNATAAAASDNSQAWYSASDDEVNADDTLDGTAWSGGEPPAPANPNAGGRPFSSNFLTLGIFALVPQGQNEPSALVQLSLGRDGSLRGSYSDVVTDEAAAVFGSVDKQTQAAQFQVGQNSKVTFTTSLNDLTSAEGTVSVRYGNGPARTWTLVRQVRDDNPTIKTGSPD